MVDITANSPATADPAAAINAGFNVPPLAPAAIDPAASAATPAAVAPAAATPAAVAPVEPVVAPQPAPVAELGKIGSAKVATFALVKKARPQEYVDAIYSVLRDQFSVPAAASDASEYVLGDQSVVVFSFPVNPGFMEYDVLTAYVVKACESLSA